MPIYFLFCVNRKETKESPTQRFRYRTWRSEAENSLTLSLRSFERNEFPSFILVVRLAKMLKSEELRHWTLYRTDDQRANKSRKLSNFVLQVTGVCRLTYSIGSWSYLEKFTWLCNFCKMAMSTLQDGHVSARTWRCRWAWLSNSFHYLRKALLSRDFKY